MIELKLIGQPTHNYQVLKNRLELLAIESHIRFTIKEINDIDSIIKENVKSIPAIRINGQFQLNFDQNKDVDLLMQEISGALIKELKIQTMKKILVPIDFSEMTHKTIEHAIFYAKRLNAQIELCHIYIPSAVDMGMDVNAASQAAVKEKLDELHAETIDKFSQEDVMISRSFYVGFPATRIGEIAEEQDAMILMGSTGQSGFVKKFFGSVTTLVSQKAKQPVLIVPPSSEHKIHKNIVWAYDGKTHTEEIIQEVANFAKAFKANIHIVHVDDAFISKHFIELESALKAVYDDTQVFNHLVKSDDTNQGLNNFVENEDIDLIVMTHKEKSFFDSLLHPSETRKMAINSKVPVLIFHQK